MWQGERKERGDIPAMAFVARLYNLKSKDVKDCIEFCGKKNVKRTQLNKKSVAALIKVCTRLFNAFIRKRDAGKPCINCGQYRTLQAGHFYATSTYSGLRFNEDGCNGECIQCNYFNSQSHAQGYAPNLLKKIGQERFDKLKNQADYLKRHPHKWTRQELLILIEKYSS